jgi:hypothetical protein
MISNKVLPAHILRLYTWELMRANLDWTEIDNLIPVVPLEMEPKLVDSGKSYLVYGWAEQSSGRTPEICRGTFSLRIIARSFGELGWIMNTIIRAFDHIDITDSLNDWSSDFSQQSLVGIRFTNLEVTYAEGGNAPTSEGGPTEGLVNIAYNYISHQPVKTYTKTHAGSGWS